MRFMKIAFIGFCGHVGYAIEGIKRNPELQIVGASSADPVDRNPDALAKLAIAANGRFYEDFRVMLDETRPDVAVVATRYDRNAVVSAECLRRGVNCFTEKAVAHNRETLEDLRAAAKEGNARIIGMHGMRYLPEYHAAYKAVHERAIGKPMLFTGQKSYVFGNHRPDFYRRRETYGGTILWVAVHALDWAYWIMGDIGPIHAFHSSENNFGWGECETAAVLCFSFRNGGMGTINADFYRPRAATSHGDDRMRIAGDAGVIEVFERKAYLTTHENTQTELPLEDSDFFGDFCREIRGEGTCRLSMEDTFRVTELGILARESADHAATKAKP
jgi:predicted dehydrogenase